MELNISYLEEKKVLILHKACNLMSKRGSLHSQITCASAKSIMHLSKFGLFTLHLSEQPNFAGWVCIPSFRSVSTFKHFILQIVLKIELTLKHCALKSDYSLIGERLKTFNFLWKALPANKTFLGTPLPKLLSLCSNLTSMTSRMNLLPFSMLLTLFRASTCSENEPWQAKTPTLMILQLEVKIFFSVLFIIFSLNLNWNVIFDWTWIFHNTIHVPTNQNWFLQFFRHGRWGDECASIVQGRTNSEIMFVHNFSLYSSQYLYKVFSAKVI